MRSGGAKYIIASEMAIPINAAQGREGCRSCGREMSCGRLPVQVPVAVFGDPIVGWALVLLQRPRYDTRFLPTFSSGEVGTLKGIRLVLIAPTPGFSAEQRGTLVAVLRK